MENAIADVIPYDEGTRTAAVSAACMRRFESCSLVEGEEKEAGKHHTIALPTLAHAMMGTRLDVCVRVRN